MISQSEQEQTNTIHIPDAMIFFLIPVFSSNVPKKSVTMFFSDINLSTRFLMDEKMSSRPMVLKEVLKHQRNWRKVTCGRE